MEKVLRTEEDINTLVNLTDGLHDGAVREVALVWRGHISSDRLMYGYGAPMDARIILQSQNERSPLIEIDCKGVKRFAFDAGLDLELEAEISRGGIRLFFCGADAREECVIEAESVSYRIGPLEEAGTQLLAVKEHPLFLRPA